jgi:hypothetical protein
MPKAAPVFWTWVKSTRPGIRLTLAYSGSVCRTMSFVT